MLQTLGRSFLSSPHASCPLPSQTPCHPRQFTYRIPSQLFFAERVLRTIRCPPRVIEAEPLPRIPAPRSACTSINTTPSPPTVNRVGGLPVHPPRQHLSEASAARFGNLPSGIIMYTKRRPSPSSIRQSWHTYAPIHLHDCRALFRDRSDSQSATTLNHFQIRSTSFGPRSFRVHCPSV